MKHCILFALTSLISLLSARAEQRVYWSTSDASTAGVYSAKLDGTDVRNVIDFTQNVVGAPRVPGSIAIDDINNTLYVADISTTHDILAADLDGSSQRLLVDESNLITDLDVDPTTQIVYWSTNTGYIGRKRPGFAADQNFAGTYRGVASAPISSKFFFGGPANVHYYNQPAWANGGRFNLTSTAYAVQVVEYMHATDLLAWVNPTNNKLLARRVSDLSDRELLQFPSANHIPLSMAFNRQETIIFWTNNVQGRIFSAPTSDFTVPLPPVTFASVSGLQGIALSCGVLAPNSDGDSLPDCDETCPNDAAKTSPGICGCGVSDSDSDSDGTADCLDTCPADSAKTSPGICGCSVTDKDTDTDGTADCIDSCPTDAAKTNPGSCGCGAAETDSDTDGTVNCQDLCLLDPAKINPGNCGCGKAENTSDLDNDGVLDCIDSEILRPLTPGVKITAPPAVEIMENSITVTLEKFSLVSLKKPGKGKASEVLETLEAQNVKVGSKYTVKITRKLGKSKEVRTLTTKKNLITLKNLKPGNYNISYRAEILKDGRTQAKTNFSPAASFTIN